MNTAGSITECIALLRQGNTEAAYEIWHRYFPQLSRIARVKMRHANYGIADEEDVALSALDHFCRAAQEGRFPHLADRNELWRLLIKIASRRAIDLSRKEERQRRGGRDKFALDEADARSAEERLTMALDRSPPPDLAATGRRAFS